MKVLLNDETEIPSGSAGELEGMKICLLRMMAGMQS